MKKQTEWMDSFDLYSMELPEFNFEGRKKIGSPVGVFISVIVNILVLTMATIKFIQLLESNSKPIVSEITEYNDFISKETALQVGNDNFSIAFQVTDFSTDNDLDDPAMVRWEASIVEADDSGTVSDITIKVGTHICTEADKEKFFPPSRGSKAKIEKLFKANKMHCLDSMDLDGKPLKPLELYR
jgi:hypothetical protein